MLRYVFIGGVMLFLFQQIQAIGWQKILSNLPTNPFFYLIFFVLYFALPISEQLIYGMSLDLDFRKSLKVFIKKKILNADVIGYSGEAYFYIWGKNNLNVSSKYLFQVIKDNNIISSFSSTLMAVVLLSLFVYIGQVNFMDIIGSRMSQEMLIFIGVLAITALIIGFRFRKKIISMEGDLALKVFGIHTVRIILMYALEMFMWSIVLPSVPLHIWSVFLATKIIASRLPFVPSQDLIFVSLSVGLSRILSTNSSEIASIMLASAALTKLTSFGLYLYFTAKKGLTEPNDQEGADEFKSHG